jgi:ketosteroid isomerase-like protein
MPSGIRGHATALGDLQDLREQETKLPTLEVAMSDLDDFLASTLARQVEAEEALHNGDPEPRLAMWSTQDPVTVLGALRSASGRDEVSRLFRWLGSGFSDCTSYRFELVAAGISGDLAYTVGYEHTSVSWDGAPLEPYTLRVTHAYRREDGEWKIVHRHADSPPINQTPPDDSPPIIQTPPADPSTE